MASAYSQPQTYLPYTPTTDLNLINTVLGAKQERYDAGVAQIDSLLQEFGNIDIAKESDKEYLYGKLKTLTDQVNKYGKLNFSNKDVTRNVKNHIKGALDERVINSIADTQKYRNYQATAEAAKKEGNYADLNYQVGLMQAGFTDWMNDETGQVRLGNLNYTPYEDVNSTLMKSLKEASAIKGGKRVIQVQDPTMPGRLIEKSIDGLTQAELQDIIPSLLNERGRAQLRVNGYYKFQGNTEAARDTLRAQYDSKISRIDTTIENLQTKINSGKASQAQIQEFKSQITNLEAIKTKNLKQVDSIASGNASTIGGFLEEENLTNSLSSALKATESSKYVEDQAYFSDLAQKAKEREDALKQGTATGASGVTSIPIATDQVDSFDFYEHVKEEGRKLETDLTTTVNSQYNALNPTQKQKVDSLMQGEDYALLNDRDKRIKALKESGFIDPEVEGDINRLDRKYKNYLIDDEQAYSTALTESLTNTELWDEFQDDSLLGNSLIKIVDEETGEKVTYKDYLERRGVASKEQYENFINDPEASRTFKAKFATDYFLSSSAASKLTFGAYNNNIGKALQQGNVLGSIDNNILTQFDRLKAITGESDLKFTDVFDVRTIESGLDPRLRGESSREAFARDDNKATEDYIKDHKGDLTENYAIRLNPNARGTRIYDIITQAVSVGTFNRDNIISELSLDNSVIDDPQLSSALSTDAIIKTYTDKVSTSGIRIRGGNAIAVPPSMSSTKTNAVFEGLRNQMAQASPTFVPSDLQRGDRVPGYLDKLEYGVAVQLRRDVSNPDQFIVTQGNKSAIIPVRALRNEPAVVEAIELDDGSQEIINENQEPIEITNISYKPSNQKNNIYLGERYGFNSDQYLAATREGASILLEQANPYLYSEQAPPEFAQTFQAALSNADKFSAVVQNYRGRTYVEVFYDGEKISEVAGAERDRIEDFVDYDPQVFITTALTNIAKELQFKNNENFAKLYARIYGQ